MIEFREVHKRYPQGKREVTALDGITLTIGKGEFVAVTGASGSGKSTFLHLAGGLDLPTSGDVVIDGRSSSQLPDLELTRLRRERIGLVFQFFNLIPTLTVLENTALPRMVSGVGFRAARPRAEALLDRFGLADRLDHLPEELSGGEMQRVAIARALVIDPEVVLADEPTGNLDSATGQDILSIFTELASECTIVMVTHNPEAAALAGRIVRLRDGRLEDDTAQ